MRRFSATILRATASCVVLSATLGALPAKAAERLLVRTQDEYRRAVERAGPGDTVVLADGEWRDFRIVLRGRGKPGAPIALTAETKGQVLVTGKSDLKLAGEHLLVSGLVFTDGHTPSGEVIAFRGKAGEVATDSRVTEVVIDRFNNPAKGESDNWVALYGRDNRFDHSQLVGKANLGATLVVVRDPEHGLENRHRVDHVWFGPRPNLGSNGGETVRIGTSHHSLTDSFTVLENNWFEHTDGEVEIVSVKSGANVMRGNVFFRSRGALVLRHGDGNLVENNVFLGGGESHTGGVRVINRRQTVRNNYFEGLRGEGFANALSVMNGVPNSPVNRYFQVEGAAIENNTFVDVESLEFGSGADAERSLAPRDSRFARNLIVSDGRADPFRLRAAVDGIAFEGNVRTPADSPALTTGFRTGAVATTRNAAGLLEPRSWRTRVGARGLKPIARDQVGVSWWPKTTPPAMSEAGAEIAVAAEEGALARAVAAAKPGEVLRLAPGRHLVDEVLAVGKPLTLKGPGGEGAPTAEIAFTRRTLFQIEDGGSLRLARIAVTGAAAPDATGNAVIRTSPRGLLHSPEIVVEDSRFADLDVNNAFSVLVLSKGSMAERVALRNVIVENATGAVVKADTETDDLGLYNVERLEIADSVFRNVRGEVADVYRGGTDESTFGPEVRIADVTVEASGRSGASLDLRGVQRASVERAVFRNSGPIAVLHTVGSPSLRIAESTFEGTPEPRLNAASARVEPRVSLQNNVVTGQRP